MKSAATILVLAIMTAGCGSQDYKKVTDESIVDKNAPDESIVDAGLKVNLLANPSFDNGVLPPWSAQVPDNSNLSITDATAHRGKYSLRFQQPKESPKEIVNISQSVDLQNVGAGSRYRLTEWVRARNLSKSISFQLRLNNADGTYDFVSVDTAGRRVVIPKGDAGWTKLKFEAKVSEPLSGMTVVAAGSFADFTGVFWVDDVSLTLPD